MGPLEEAASRLGKSSAHCADRSAKLPCRSASRNQTGGLRGAGVVASSWGTAAAAATKHTRPTIDFMFF